MKFCVDCRHYKKSISEDDRYHFCLSPKVRTPSLITGKGYPEVVYCGEQRYPKGFTFRHVCGPNAQFFERKIEDRS